MSDKSALFEDIIYKMEKILKRDLSKASIHTATQNAEESITDYFKLYAFEKSFENDSFDCVDSSLLVTKLKQGLPDEEADVLIYTVAELLKKPSDDQKTILTEWCKTYVGCQVLKLDPRQNKLQGKEFKDKNFVLDTDFILNLIVEEVDENTLYKRIVLKILDFDANLLIPLKVLDEVIKHAEFSHGNYKYFANKFDSLDPLVFEQQIANIFTKGFFEGKRKGLIPAELQFKEYLKNYYQQRDPKEYLKDFIKDNISSKISFVELSALDLKDEEYSLLEELKEKVLRLTLNTPKSVYRDEEENREIANIDARIYVNYLHENRKNLPSHTGKLKYNYYVLTTYSRILKCAKELKIFESFYVKPLNIISLIKRIEPFDLSYEEITNLFENPFLTYVVSENWGVVEKLLEIGVDLREANITRLKWELSDIFEKNLFVSEEDNNSFTETTYEKNGDLIKDFIDVADEISKKGYRFVPAVNKLIDSYEEERKANIKNMEKLQELESEIKKVGRRKQKYLKRIVKDINR